MSSKINDHVTSKVDKTMQLVPIPVKPPLRLLSEGCALFLEDAGWDFHENSISTVRIKLSIFKIVI